MKLRIDRRVCLAALAATASSLRRWVQLRPLRLAAHLAERGARFPVADGARPRRPPRPPPPPANTAWAIRTRSACARTPPCCRTWTPPSTASSSSIRTGSILTDQNGPGGYKVLKPAEYYQGVTASLQSAGFCAETDIVSVSVRNGIDFSEEYDILLGTGHVRRGQGSYRATCSPPTFPLDAAQVISYVRVAFYSVRCPHGVAVPRNAEDRLLLGLLRLRHRQPEDEGRPGREARPHRRPDRLDVRAGRRTRRDSTTSRTSPSTRSCSAPTPATGSSARRSRRSRAAVRRSRSSPRPRPPSQAQPTAERGGDAQRRDARGGAQGDASDRDARAPPDFASCARASLELRASGCGWSC